MARIILAMTCNIFQVKYVNICFSGFCVETLRAVHEISAIVKVLQEDMMHVEAALASSLNPGNANELVEFACH